MKNTCFKIGLLTFLCLLSIFCTIKSYGQAIYRLGDTAYGCIDSVEVLPDKVYTLQQVLHDSLPFTRTVLWKTKGYQAYWVRFYVYNPSKYDQEYYLMPRPPLDYTMYVLNEDTQNWQSQRGGALVVNGSNRGQWLRHSFRSGQRTQVYMRITLGPYTQSPHALYTSVFFAKSSMFDAQWQSRYNIWLATLAVVLVFFCYNVYLYFMFRDRTYLYYLVTLLASMIYTTGVNDFFDVLLPWRYMNLVPMPGGGYYVYHLDFILQETSIVMLMAGGIQLTRHYLKTATATPVWDKVMRWSMLVFCSVLLVGIAIFSISWLPVRSLFIQFMNYGILVLIGQMFVAGILRLRQRYKPAKYFLFAQTLPMLCLVVITLYHHFGYGELTLYNVLLPSIAIVVYALTFAVALVAGVNLLKQSLQQKELEAQTLQNQKEQQVLRTAALEEQVRHHEKEMAYAETLKALMRELHHRVKNNLQIVSSLLSLQSFRITDRTAAAAVREGQHRIEAMSLIHQRLYTHDNITEINIKHFVTDLSESLMQAYGFARDQFELVLNIDNEMMDVDKAIPIGLIINELMTNAFKYAYAGVQKPALHISLTKQESLLQLIVADNGKGLDTQQWHEADGSYGKELVKTFTQQLSGTLEVEVRNGTVFTLMIPYYLQPQYKA